MWAVHRPRRPVEREGWARRVRPAGPRTSHWVQDCKWTDCLAAQPCLLWEDGVEVALQWEWPVYYNWRLLREGNTNRQGVALKANTNTSDGFATYPSSRFSPGWETLRGESAQKIRACLLRPLRVTELKWGSGLWEDPQGRVATPRLQLFQQSLTQW